MNDVLDEAFLDGATACSALLRSDALRQNWDRPSALPEMSVGALACHLARQVSRAAELLTESSELPPLDSAAEHYARAAWVTAESPDDPANDRTTDDAEAARGFDWMVQRFDADFADVADRLRSGVAAEAVGIPWQGWSLRRKDFLHTRLLEIVVHTTDLAASIELPAPQFPDTAFLPVLDLLTRLAVRRRGQAAVIGTLTRRERTRTISAF
ncbi:maleylpyruvate isomerase N-terminal domain-containing protein [Amycolatopsis jiangsuensis]|uniref:Mycothiol-dependent maleylpyruvate isomerase metal-binding domain-containing protein n=1 Tax=Amycolatopsis jiangsuensis TaxID=1181879 RepID=A0A840J067_9PSEU|nr:maleylpyruvate isomerase N-terminal domain-containing protein [Amycolatopsis jiangsuensis]MBB4687470.1 hypothetical protein [Amycolatopsis jiangsuensis]